MSTVTLTQETVNFYEKASSLLDLGYFIKYRFMGIWVFEKAG